MRYDRVTSAPTSILVRKRFQFAGALRYRHVAKPGISGWAQVNQSHVARVDNVKEKLYYDFYYIKYFSPWLDLLIVFRTIKTMLTGWGAR